MLRQTLLHILAAALITGQALAQTASPAPATRPTQPAAPAKPAQPATPLATQPLPTVVALDTESCRKLVARQPRNVPGADYVPGVDVKGRAVAPADLPASANLGSGGSSMLDPRFGIQLKFTLGELLGSRVPPRAKQAELTVGQLELDPATGRLNFGSQVIEKPAEDAVLAACREHLAKPPAKR